MGRPHIDRAPPTKLGNISSLAFAGPDLRTAYLGSLVGTSLACLTMPVAGRKPSHWDHDLGPIREP
jgi:hypothetical protein